MNKKIIPIIITIAIILLGLGIYLFITLNPGRREGLQNTLQNLFPFSQQQQQQPGTTPGTTTEPGQEPTTGTTIDSNVPALRQISTIPTAAYRARITEELKDMPVTTINASGETVTVNELRPVRTYSVRFAGINEGAVYESVIGNEITTTQLTDITIPANGRLLFNADGSAVSAQYAAGPIGSERISTYAFSIDKIPLNVEVCPFAFPVNIKFQDNNDAVANIQRFLNGYLGIIISETGENSPGNETGIFDELTRNAIMRFQTGHNLTADGSVGPKTRQAFMDACMVVQTQKAQERYQQNNQFLYQANGSFIGDNITDIQNVSDREFFYFAKNTAKTFGFIFNAITKASQQVFDSTFNEWLAQPLSKDKILLTTKASSQAPGYVYELNTKSGTMVKIIGDIAGLTTLASPDGNTVLVGATTNNGYGLSLLQRSDNSRKNIGIATFPEKCVWSDDSVTIYCAVPDSLPNAPYPDAWYQGVVTTEDSLWSVNTVTGSTQKLYDPKQVINGGIMAGDLQVSADERYLFMKNYNDDTIWVLSLFQ